MTVTAALLGTALVLALAAPAPGGPPNATFARGLEEWTLQGPGRVTVRAGGPSGLPYAAVRDNTTLVSAPFLVPAATQTLTLLARGLAGQETLRVLALPDGAAAPVELGTLALGRSWASLAVGAGRVAGRSVRLLLDPVLGFGDGLDLARVGEPQGLDAGLALQAGAVRHVPGGPDGVRLVAVPGRLRLRTAPLRLPADAVTVSLWLRSGTAATPQVVVEADGRRLGDGRAGPSWAPLRVAAGALRGRTVRLTLLSAQAAGLQLARIGTVQRAPALALEVRSAGPRRLALSLRGAAVVAGRRVAVQGRAGGAWSTLTSVRLPAAGNGVVSVLRPAGVELVRVRYAGSEIAAPGVSAPRRVPG